MSKIPRLDDDTVISIVSFIKSDILDETLEALKPYREYEDLNEKLGEDLFSIESVDLEELEHAAAGVYDQVAHMQKVARRKNAAYVRFVDI